MKLSTKQDNLRLDDVKKASRQLAGVVQQTPLDLCERYSERFGAQVYLSAKIFSRFDHIN